MKSRTGKSFYPGGGGAGVPRNHGIEPEDGPNINGRKEEDSEEPGP